MLDPRPGNDQTTRTQPSGVLFSAESSEEKPFQSRVEKEVSARLNNGLPTQLRNPKGSKDSYFKVFGPKDEII